MLNPPPQIGLIGTNRGLSAQNWKHFAARVRAAGGVAPHMFEWLPNGVESPLARCLREMQRRNAIIYIHGTHPGTPVLGEDFTYTEYELQAAFELGIPVFSFVPDSERKVRNADLAQEDDDPRAVLRLNRIRAATSGLLRGAYRTLEALEEAIEEVVKNFVEQDWPQERARQQRQREFLEGAPTVSPAPNLEVTFRVERRDTYQEVQPISAFNTAGAATFGFIAGRPAWAWGISGADVKAGSLLRLRGTGYATAVEDDDILIEFNANEVLGAVTAWAA